MFSDREKFIMVMTAMVTSPTATKLPRDVRQTLLDYIKNKHCKSVTDAQWHEIAQDINETNIMLKDEMMNGAMKAAEGHGNDVADDPTLRKVEEIIQKNKDEINLDELAKKSRDLGVKKTLLGFKGWGKKKNDD